MEKKPTSKNKRTIAKKIWIPVLAILLVLLGGLGYFYWQQQGTQSQDTSTNTVNTTQVRQGSITLSVSGSGTLAAGQESKLAFSTSGTVAKVTVQVGDKVKKGDELAELLNFTALQDNVNSAQQVLISAQQDLATLKQSAAYNLANAQLAVITAQKAVTDAKSNVVKKGWVRCDQKTTDAYYEAYTKAKKVLDDVGTGDGSANYYQNIVVPQKNIASKAFSDYEYCAAFTDTEITTSTATLTLDEAKLQQAQNTLNTLTQNNGVDPTELAKAENKVSSAQVALDNANTTLAGARLTAPYDGTILSVAGVAGETVDKSTFISIADLENPILNFSVDEADMDKIAVGQTAEVVFDALPEDTFQGKLTRINPELSTSGSYKVVTGVIQLELSQNSASAGADSKLIKGLTGTVTLIQASAEKVLVVPIAALRDLGDGSYSVFVVGTDGRIKMKGVQIGLKDSTSAEIKSGLSAGDVVTTGTTQAKPIVN